MCHQPTPPPAHAVSIVGALLSWHHAVLYDGGLSSTQSVGPVAQALPSCTHLNWALSATITQEIGLTDQGWGVH